MWYVGSRTAKNCHPDDGYICSSKHVTPLIKNSPDDWHRTILLIAPPLYVREIEAKYLLSLNARNDQLSYNRHNGDMKFHTIGSKLTEEHKRKISPKGRVCSDATKAKMRENSIGSNNPFFGKTHSPEYIQQIRLRMINNNPSKTEEVKQKLSKILGGRLSKQTVTPETLAKKSLSAKNAWANGLYKNRAIANWVPTEEQRLKIRTARAKQAPPSLGKTHSSEAKAKMAESKRLYWLKRKESA